MTATYVKNPEDGQVHVIVQAGDGEFTFCDRDYGQAVDGGFYGLECSGPATCAECREGADEYRASLKGVLGGDYESPSRL